MPRRGVVIKEIIVGRSLCATRGGLVLSPFRIAYLSFLRIMFGKIRDLGKPRDGGLKADSEAETEQREKRSTLYDELQPTIGRQLPAHHYYYILYCLAAPTSTIGNHGNPEVAVDCTQRVPTWKYRTTLPTERRR